MARPKGSTRWGASGCDVGLSIVGIIFGCCTRAYHKQCEPCTALPADDVQPPERVRRPQRQEAATSLHIDMGILADIGHWVKQAPKNAPPPAARLSEANYQDEIREVQFLGLVGAGQG